MNSFIKNTLNKMPPRRYKTIADYNSIIAGQRTMCNRKLSKLEASRARLEKRATKEAAKATRKPRMNYRKTEQELAARMNALRG